MAFPSPSPKPSSNGSTTASAANSPSFSADSRRRAGHKQQLASIGIGLALLAILLSNGRAIGGGDTVPATLLPLALARGDGPFLDRYERQLRGADGRLPGYLDWRRDHVVSRYPIGPALVALPFESPIILALDVLSPKWDNDWRRTVAFARALGKLSAAAITAISALLLASALKILGLAREAWPATLTVFLGSDAWSMGGQALWQHGPAVLCFSLSIWCLIREPGSNRLAALAGLATAMMVVCRPIDVVFAATIGLWVLVHEPRPRRWSFFSPALGVAIAWSAYQVWFFDSLNGGYVEIEKMHPWAHGTKGTWTAPLFDGALGTLFSPSHGLLIYCPWLALALAAAPFATRESAELRRVWSLPVWLICSLVPYFLFLAKYSCWWGGHCFGPRFWIDANPVFGVLLALVLRWSGEAGRTWARIALAATAGVAIALQAVGAFCYPSSWYGSPRSADRHHERLWDWRDTEVSRCLREGPMATRR